VVHGLIGTGKETSDSWESQEGWLDIETSHVISGTHTAGVTQDTTERGQCGLRKYICS
jgi:hypothetical protein